MARDLGVLKHGSAEEMAKAVNPHKTGLALVTVRFLQRSTTGAPRQDPLTVPDQGNVPNDYFFGMATIHFPSIPAPEIIENGLWCRGCELTLKEYTDTYSATRAMLRRVPRPCPP
ncbi:f-box domain-containing protein [Ilyonectria robusta]